MMVISFVGALGERRLEVELAHRVVHAPRRVPYRPHPEDVVEQHALELRVTRGARELGKLVGPHSDQLFEFERVQGERLDVTQLTRPEVFALTVQGEPRRVSTVTRKSSPERVARVGSWAFDASEKHVFILELDQDLECGSACALELLPESSPRLMHAFWFDRRLMRSRAVHVNQIGFRQDDPCKLAHVHRWLGDAGALQLGAGAEFELIDELTDASCFTDKLSEVELDRGRSLVGSHAYRADFSGFDLPGKYRVYVTGLGCSAPFEIGYDTWKRAFSVAVRGFLHQRRSIELGPPHTGYRRRAGLDPKLGLKVFESRASLMGSGNGLSQSDRSNFGYLVEGATPNTLGGECWGGLMDAGDWDSRIQHLVVSTDLLELVEAFPESLGKMRFGLPESSSSLPDLLSEALFNLSHYKRLQLPNGAIRGGVESEEHPRVGEASWEESLRVFAYAPDAWSSYLYAAAASRAAELLADRDPAESSAYRQSASAAFDWAEQNRHEPCDVPRELEYARRLAAAARFRLTGEARAHDIFESLTCVGSDRGVGFMVSGWADPLQADFLYATTSNAPEGPTLARCRERLLTEADRRVAESEHPLCWTLSDQPLWGGLLHRSRRNLARAHRLTGEQRYLEALIRLSLAPLGDNPLDLVYTTGLGQNPVAYPLHIDSWVTGQPAPKGLTILGPMDFSNEWPEGFVEPVTSFFHPPLRAWPALECFWNMTWFVMQSEYTVQYPMSETAYVLGYLAARAELSGAA